MNRRVLIPMIAAVTLLPLMGRAELAESPEKVHPLDKGAAVPDVTLQTVDGKKFALKAETSAQPTVIIFYRGGWCPFCNAHLADVQKHIPERTPEKNALQQKFKDDRKSGAPIAGLSEWNARWVGPEGYKGMVAKQMQEFKRKQKKGLRPCPTLTMT